MREINLDLSPPRNINFEEIKRSVKGVNKNLVLNYLFSAKTVLNLFGIPFVANGRGRFLLDSGSAGKLLFIELTNNCTVVKLG